MLNYISSAIGEFTTAKNLECYLTSFINTCKKCKFEIPNYNLLRPVYTDGTDVSNKLEIDTSKLALRDKPNEKYIPKPNTNIEIPPTVPTKPTETQAVVIATPSIEILPEPKPGITGIISMVKETEINLPQENTDISNKDKPECDEREIMSETIVDDQRTCIKTTESEPVVESDFKQEQAKEKELDLSQFTAEEIDLISMVKEGWHATDIMKYFGIRSKNVLKVRLCDLAIRGVNISNVDWNPSNRFSTKVQKNGSVILSASKLHNCNFILNPGDEVQIICKDGNLILTHKK